MRRQKNRLQTKKRTKKNEKERETECFQKKTFHKETTKQIIQNNKIIIVCNITVLYSLTKLSGLFQGE